MSDKHKWLSFPEWAKKTGNNKTLLYLLFNTGKIPKEYAQKIEVKKVTYLIREDFTYKVRKPKSK